MLWVPGGGETIKLAVLRLQGLTGFLQWEERRKPDYMDKRVDGGEVAKGNMRNVSWGFPGGAMVENLPANAGDTGSSPGLGRSHMPRSN